MEERKYEIIPFLGGCVRIHFDNEWIELYDIDCLSDIDDLFCILEQLDGERL